MFPQMSQICIVNLGNGFNEFEYHAINLKITSQILSAMLLAHETFWCLTVMEWNILTLEGKNEGA